jgi:hypothetical protein
MRIRIALTYEHIHLTKEDQNECWNYLEQLGYSYLLIRVTLLLFFLGSKSSTISHSKSLKLFE